jgi:hypothetical protein
MTAKKERTEVSTWQLDDGTASNDWPRYRERLEDVAARRGFALESLGQAGGYPLLFGRRRATTPGARRLMIASGFHGDESAGPWGLLAFLESADPSLLDAVDLSILPLVNVTGFRAGTRLNAAGENPNRGYRPGEESPSFEGRLLLACGERMLAAARDGLLTCHEDVPMSQAYVYGMEPRDTPGAFSRGLLAANARFFEVHPDGEIEGRPVRDGIVLNHWDTSFEAWLYESGVPLAATVETPGQHPIDRRVAAQAAMMQFFTGFVPSAQDSTAPMA